MKPLLIVDGYNILGAWPEMNRHQWTLEDGRSQLLIRLEDFSGYSGDEIVLVFDGYQSENKLRTLEQHGNVQVVYTCHGETADSYIERLVAQTPKYRTIRVATSDGLEQSQVLSTGAARLTARELLMDMAEARRQGYRIHASAQKLKQGAIGSRLPAHVLEELERRRRG